MLNFTNHQENSNTNEIFFSSFKLVMLKRLVMANIGNLGEQCGWAY